ncbi:MAG TPA: hypothetical protein VNL92_04870, partial [Dehalococcoidia bacterium]|nr:hypothetical protein [Dehalococcoidia bacterium]
QVLDPGPAGRQHISDRNGDGTITLGCLGDSNTREIALGGNTFLGWCRIIDAQLATLGGRWSAINLGVPAATAVRFADWPSAYDQLDLALQREDADIVVLSFGSGDIPFVTAAARPLTVAYACQEGALMADLSWSPASDQADIWVDEGGDGEFEQFIDVSPHQSSLRLEAGQARRVDYFLIGEDLRTITANRGRASPTCSDQPATFAPTASRQLTLDDIVAAYLDLVSTAASQNVPAYVALTPLYNNGDWRQNRLVLELNNMLDHELPNAALIDTASIMTEDDYYDALHANQRGQSRRAEAIFRAIAISFR